MWVLHSWSTVLKARAWIRNPFGTICISWSFACPYLLFHPLEVILKYENKLLNHGGQLYMQYSEIFRLEERPAADIWLSVWIFKKFKSTESCLDKSRPPHFVASNSVTPCSVVIFVLVIRQRSLSARHPGGADGDTLGSRWHSAPPWFLRGGDIRGN